MESKKAGIERPYNFSEFTDLVESMAKDLDYFNHLDYFNSYAKKDVIDTDDFYVESKTSFGSSEGIYTDFVIVTESYTRTFCVAKTLGESDDDYIKMHILGARICLLIRKYLCEHSDEFNWRGFDVGYYLENGEVKPCYWCGKKENAITRASEMKQNGFTPVIRDNATRKEVKF